MRGIAIAIACVLGLGAMLYLLGTTFDTSARHPAHAMELAQVRAEAAAAKAEAERARSDLEKAKAELKKAMDTNEELKRKVAGLERRLHPSDPRQQGKGCSLHPGKFLEISQLMRVWKGSPWSTRDKEWVAWESAGGLKYFEDHFAWSLADVI